MTPTRVGTGLAQNATTFISISQAVPVGHTLALFFAENNGRGIQVTGVIDGYGNTWVQRYNGVAVNGFSGDLSIWETTVTTQLNSGGSVRLTFSAAPSGGVDIFDLGPNMTFDSVGLGSAASVPNTMSVSTAVAQNGELVIGAATNGTVQSPGFTVIGNWVNPLAYEEGVAAGTATFAVTVTSSATNSSVGNVIAYKGPPPAQTISPSGVSSASALGSPTVTGGIRTVRITGIPPSDAVGDPVITSTSTVSPTGIASSAAVGRPMVAAFIIWPTGIPSSAAIGTPTISQGLPPGPTPTPPLVRVPLVQNNSRYKFIITDMMGNVQGEVLEASNKEFIQVLDNMQTAKFTVKISNPMADYILNNDCLCKCYRQPVNRNLEYRLLLVGDVITCEEDTSNETGAITFTVVDPLQRLMYRLLGKEVDSHNHGTGFSVGTPDNPSNIVDIVAAMLAEINGDPQLGHCGVGMGTRSANTPDAFLAPVYFQPFATQLAVYTAALDGLDFWMMPVEPYSLAAYPPTPGHHPFLTGGPPAGTPVDQIVKGTSVQDTIIARLNLYWPVGNYLVSAGPPPVYSRNHPFPVFEYGVGKRNLQAYRRIKDKSQLVNMWHNLPDGFPSTNHTNDPVVRTQTNTVTPEGTVQTSINRRGGWESVDPTDLGSEQPQGPIISGGGGQPTLSRMRPQAALDAALTVRSMRQQLVNTEAQVTAMPRQQIQFTPTINSDTDWTVDYFVGDIVTVRAYIQETSSWRFNGTCRIYGVNAAIDDNEQEQITVTTVPANASSL